MAVGQRHLAWLAGIAGHAFAADMMTVEPRAGKGNWIRTPPGDKGSAKPSVRLVCFHHGGGGASSFNGWYRWLPPDIELLRVQLPGREDRIEEALLGNVDDVVAGLLAPLVTLFDRPVAFYGHSLGSIIAFEAIRELRKSGNRLPTTLFVSGRRAPQLPLSHPAFCLAKEDRLVDYLISMGGMPDSALTRRHWRDALLPVIREDLRISDLYFYRHETPLPCPIVYFSGAADTWVKMPERQAWSAQTSATYRLRELGGGHFFSRDEQAVLVADITRSLLGAEGRDDMRPFSPSVSDENRGARTGRF